MSAPDPSPQGSALRALPGIDRLLDRSEWDGAAHVPLTVRRSACRAVVAELRAGILAGELGTEDCALELVAGRAVARALQDAAPVLRPVINATGVILHTNLGRAPLPQAALDAIGQLGGGYLNLEMNTETGRRDNRFQRLESSFCRVLGCADVVVTNNNAAAVFLALCALAGDGSPVVVSRGELVEIGGSFRMPDIMEASGAELVEVGTTNRTHLKDYEAAFERGARLAMKVHRSNFAVTGFTEEVSIEDLSSSAHAAGARVLHDLGCGLLRERGQLGRETVTRSLKAGVDAVLFSGDKLLGGPQCGIIAGTAATVGVLRGHPVMRLVRPGKLTLLALEATLLAWERDSTGGLVPTARMAARSVDELRTAAEDLAEHIRAAVGAQSAVEVVATESTPGGGSAADVRLPSFAVELRPTDCTEAELLASLRQHDRPVIGRAEGGAVLLDVRTLLPSDDETVTEAMRLWAEAQS